MEHHVLVHDIIILDSGQIASLSSLTNSPSPNIQIFNHIELTYIN
jgi:hypothetical protein